MYRNKPINNWRHLEDRHTTVRDNNVFNVKQKLGLMNQQFKLIKFNLEDADIRLESELEFSKREFLNETCKSK